MTSSKAKTHVVIRKTTNCRSYDHTGPIRRADTRISNHPLRIRHARCSTPCFKFDSGACSTRTAAVLSSSSARGVQRQVRVRWCLFVGFADVKAGAEGVVGLDDTLHLAIEMAVVKVRRQVATGGGGGRSRTSYTASSSRAPTDRVAPSAPTAKTWKRLLNELGDLAIKSKI